MCKYLNAGESIRSFCQMSSTMRPVVLRPYWRTETHTASFMTNISSDVSTMCLWIPPQWCSSRRPWWKPRPLCWLHCGQTVGIFNQSRPLEELLSRSTLNAWADWAKTNFFMKGINVPSVNTHVVSNQKQMLRLTNKTPFTGFIIARKT